MGIFQVRDDRFVPRFTAIFLTTILTAGFSYAKTPIAEISCASKIARRGHVGVVDMYSSGAAIAQKLRDRGYEPVHIMSTLEPFECYKHCVAKPQPNASGVTTEWPEIRHDGNLASTVERLAPYHLLAVFPGSEPGVELADELSSKLKLSLTAPNAARPVGISSRCRKFCGSRESIAFAR